MQLLWPQVLVDTATVLLEEVRAKHLHIVTAESCTGGLVAALLTEIPGSSDVFDRGYVTYSNEAKHQELQVPLNIIQQHGAVSEPVAAKMAEGARIASETQLAVSITGIAGPGGGTKEKPVGMVCFGLSTKNQTQAHTHLFTGSRNQIRLLAVEQALNYLRQAASLL